jgi:hypothetical protein
VASAVAIHRNNIVSLSECHKTRYCFAALQKENIILKALKNSVMIMARVLDQYGKLLFQTPTATCQDTELLLLGNLLSEALKECPVFKKLKNEDTKLWHTCPVVAVKSSTSSSTASSYYYLASQSTRNR